jgi:hypothetical protein
MAMIQIRDFPEAEKQILVEMAASRGVSLNTVARDALIREASFAHNLGMVDRASAIGANSRFTLNDALDALDEGRTRR